MITSLYQSLCNMETNIADRVALRWYDEEKQGVAEVHYAQYAQDLRRFVAFLRAEYGDVRGKRVAILARNSYQYVICMYGTVIAGGVAVPLNLGKDWDAISYELGLTEPVCILQDGEFAEREQLVHGSLQVCGVLLALLVLVLCDAQIIIVVLGALHLRHDAVHIQHRLRVLFQHLDPAFFQKGIERFLIHSALRSQRLGLLGRNGAFAFRQQFL